MKCTAVQIPQVFDCYEVCLLFLSQQQHFGSAVKFVCATRATISRTARVAFQRLLYPLLAAFLLYSCL